MLDLRFREWLFNEAIESLPWTGGVRDLDKYYNNKLKQFKTLEAKLVGIMDNIETTQEIFKDFIGRQPGWESIDSDIPYWLIRLSRSKEYDYPFSSTLNSFINLYLKEGNNQVLRGAEHIEKAIPPFEEYRKHSRDFYESYNKIRRGFEVSMSDLEDERKYFKGESEGDDDYLTWREAKEVITKTKEQLGDLVKYASLLYEVRKKTLALADRVSVALKSQHSRDYEKRDLLPKHKDQDVLYHATVSMNKVLSQGLKTKKEAGVEGLGGGPTDLISLTGDYRIAREIARTTRDMIAIAKGQVREEEILNQAKKDGIDVEKMVKDTKYRAGSGDSHEDYLIKLFNTYLWAAEDKGIRYNPTFWGADVERFKNLDPNQVGVLAVLTDMSKVESYRGIGEEEFRVPSDAVLKVWKMKG